MPSTQQQNEPAAGKAGRLTVDDILFNPQQPSLSAVVTSLKRGNLSIHNRLTSIVSDAQFVHSAAGTLKRPLVANERCGSWYVPPDRKDASAYFKSTDGHERAWKFSTRRLNMHLVDMIEKHDGVIIVDSTRRGKRMPDALSTTIPIWCAVLNTAILGLETKLFLPPHLLATTHAQVTALLPSFVSSLRGLNLALPVLTKPLRPYWITQDSANMPATGVVFDDYRPVFCLTASSRNNDAHSYVQGAGDDTENWAHGLTPPLFWDNMAQLLSANEQHLPDLIADLVIRQHQKADHGPSDATPRTQLTSLISVCAAPPTRHHDDECIIILDSTKATPKHEWIRSQTHMEVGLGKNTKASAKGLRLALPDICAFAAACWHASPQAEVVVACESGRDASVGAALAMSCYMFDELGRFRPPPEGASFTKHQVKVKLASVMTAHAHANPSRQTLQSVNSFLMNWTRQ